MMTQLPSPKSGLPSRKRGQRPSILGPCLLGPSGWMEQSTWYDGRHRPGQHCVRCRPSSTRKGHSPQISAHVCCGQTAEGIKMPLGTKVGLGPGRIVMGTQLPLPKEAQPPNFQPMSIVDKCRPSQLPLSTCSLSFPVVNINISNLRFKL